VSNPTVIWDGHSSTITRTTANAVMMAKQQQNHLAETLSNKGSVDHSFMNRVQNNLPSKIKEAYNQIDLQTKAPVPSVVEGKESTKLVAQEKWLSAHPYPISVRIKVG
jgi:hypothetical protein